MDADDWEAISMPGWHMRIPKMMGGHKDKDGHMMARIRLSDS
jgi:hypothetical protein